MATVYIHELRWLRTIFYRPASQIPTIVRPSNHFYSFSSPFSSSSTSRLDFTADYSIFLSNHALQSLNACQHVTHLFQIQAQLITSGIFQIQNPSFAGRVLKLSRELCDIDYTLLIFRSIELPDTYCVNTVIKAFACSSTPHNAVIFYFEMLKNGFFPNCFTFPSLVSSCAKMGCLKSGLRCHGQAVKHGVDGVLPVQNSLIHLYACCGLMGIARQVLVEMSVRDLVSWNTMLDGFAKNGDLDMAHNLFDAMPRKNVISWNVLITGYLNVGNPGCVLKLFRKMVEIGLMGNDTTMVSLLTACSQSARLKEGRSVHGSIVKAFVNLSLMIDTALIDIYGRCGRADIAQIIFDRMSSRNLVCWNAMILGHCIHGNPRDGFNLYAEMVGMTMSDHGEIDFGKRIKLNREQAILPDEITFIGVLCACAREGLLTEGRKYFSEMIDVFHLRPNFAHYWCMANLFASVGLIQEAVEILRNMPVNEDISSVAALLGSCKFQGDVNLGEQIGKALIEQDPHNFLHYALLVNVYAVAGQWDKVARMKKIMNEKGFKRMPGCSLADLKEIVHNFKTEHQWPQGIQEINMAHLVDLLN